MPVVNLSSPWVILYHEIKAMFAEDKDVKVVLNEKEYVISVYTNSCQKSAAISRILIKERVYGNVHVKIQVPPPNCTEEVKPMNSVEETYKEAFKNNPALSYTLRMSLPMVDENVYIVFRNKVVQYFNDNLLDVNGFKSTLYEDIARDIFENSMSEIPCFCTDVPENLGKPLGEWP